MGCMWPKAALTSKAISIRIELSIQVKSSIFLMVVLMTGDMGKLEFNVETIAFILDLVDKVPLCSESAIGKSVSACQSNISTVFIEKAFAIC